MSGTKEYESADREFLAGYDISRYDRPSIAADIAVFSVGRKLSVDADYRRLPEKTLRLLMVRRAKQPFCGEWALPGGFMQKNETIQQTARRELKEETGTDKAYLSLCDVFSDSGRDPRGWIVSQSFIAVLNEDDLADGRLEAGGDAGEAGWFDITVQKQAEHRREQGNEITCDNDYELTLVRSVCGEESEERITLFAVVREHIEYRDHHEIITYEIVQSQGIAFDHARIVTGAFNRLQRMLDSDIRIAFDFMPEQFTLTDLQEAVELISGQELIKPNFRRKVNEYVRETDTQVLNGGHRPAKAYVRNLERFYR
ncbi:MAG: NUDIX hydrolase [Lachnospiraceae bacterium]|nr:NUDIX hydrolase [Lachnospiraceae bacterium]